MNDNYEEINTISKDTEKCKNQYFKGESESNTAEGGRDRRNFMP